MARLGRFNLSVDGAGNSGEVGGRVARGALVGVLISGTLVFGVLAVLVAVRWAPLIGFDGSVTAAADHAALATGWLRAGARGASAVGSPVTVDVVAAVVVLGLALARLWFAAVAVAATRLGELGIETMIKVVVDRPRPVFTPPLATAAGASFPSGHAAGSAAVYLVLFLLALPWLVRRWQRVVAVLVLLLLVLAIAASRLLLGVHYPSDVVAGAGLGSACAAAAVLLTGIRRSTGRRPEPPVR